MESQVTIFGLKMMVKSPLEILISVTKFIIFGENRKIFPQFQNENFTIIVWPKILSMQW